ncbi:MAG: ABC transporter permease subunit [Ilumatobacteraceae bacterium]
MVWYLIFFIVPIAFIVVYSFGTKDSSQRIPVDLSHLTLKNYTDVFRGSARKTFVQTLRIAITATVLCLLIGLPVAYFIAFKVGEKWRAALLALVVIPSFTSFLIRTVAWKIPLAPNGFFSKWLQDIGVMDHPIQLLQTSFAVQLAIVYNYLGFVILPLFVALDRIDIRMREASKDLGAGRFATFFGVTLPLAGPGIVAAVLLTYIPMCGDYITATVLGGAKGNMIGAMIASQFSGSQDWASGAAMAVVMILAVLVTLALGAGLFYLVRWLIHASSGLFDGMRRNQWQRRLRESEQATGERRWAFDWFRPAGAVWTGLVLLFMFIPIVLVIIHSFNSGGSLTIWAGGASTVWWGRLFRGDKTWSVLITFVVVVGIGALVPRVVGLVAGKKHRLLSRWSLPVAFIGVVVYLGETTNWFREIFRDANIGDAMRNSFLAAIGATIISVLIGGLAGVALARRPGKWTIAFIFVIFLILVTPEVMDAISLSTWFPWLGDNAGFFGNQFNRGSSGPFVFGIYRLWVGQSLYASAVVTLIVRARLSGLDESLEEAAGDLGAPPGRAFRQITLPLISSALIAGALLSFTLCIDNTVISALVSDAGSSTFPVALLSAQKSAIKPFWGVGAIVLFLITMSALGFVASVLKKSGESSGQIAAMMAG